MSQAQLTEALAAFERRRLAGNVPACFIIAPYDTESAVWTQDIPRKDMLERFTALARTSLATLSSHLLRGDAVSECGSP
jgi:hypothetical protein